MDAWTGGKPAAEMGPPPHEPSGTRTTPSILAALTLNTGDRVLLEVREGWNFDPQRMDNMRATLRERFPGVEFTFLAGVHVAGVQHSDATH